MERSPTQNSDNARGDTAPIIDGGEDEYDLNGETRALERRLRLKVDLRLCTIAGILCSLNLLDSGVLGSASVTSMITDLDLTGNRYSVSIFIFTIASIAFQLPSTVAVRFLGPRIFFALITFLFGLITMCTAFVQTWKQMIALRVLLGIAMSGIYPGLTYLISTWYPRREQQTRFAFLQSGEVIILATGSIVNFGLNQLDGRGGIAGWRYMFLVQGIISMVIGFVTYFWIVDFPEEAHKSLWFLTEEEQRLAVSRIDKDRKDVEADSFSWGKVFVHAKDPKVYGFACMFFLLNLVSTSLSYFLPIILQSGMGFDENAAILLSAPPYYYAVVPVIVSSVVGDKFRLRGPVIVFNCICLIVGFCMLGFAEQVTVRYVGTFLATGAYVSNWAALSTYQANNITGQWKRVFTAAAVTAMNGAGGIAGSFIVRNNEAPRYMTAVWVSIGSHILIIVLVAAFSTYFFYANRAARAGKQILEGVEGFSCHRAKDYNQSGAMMESKVVYASTAVLFLLVLKRIFAYLFRRNSLPLPPGPAPLPLIGNVHQAPKGSPWLQFYAWGKQYGPLTHLDMAGQPVIVLNTLEAAHDLLSRRGANYSDRPRLVVAGDLVTKGQHILLRPYDAGYRLHKRMEASVLNPRAADAYRPLQELESRQLLFDLLTTSEAGCGAGEEDGKEEGTDFNHWIERFTASYVYSLLYGYRLLTGHEQPLLDAKHVQVEATKDIQMGAHLVDRFPWLNRLPGPLAPWKAHAEALYRLERNLHLGNVRRGLASPGWNFTKHLKDSSEARDMPLEELAFDVGVMGDAALDTTTMTIDWFIVAWLTENRGFVARAQKLIDEVVGRDRIPAFEDLPKLTYVTAIVSELLRWRPVVAGGVPHRYDGKKDDEYKGYRIPAGTLVIANHWGIARDESVFGANPDAFVPERWLLSEEEETAGSAEKTKDGIKDLYSTTFGFGRRVCTGQYIARNGVSIAITRLLWAFDVEPAFDRHGERTKIDPLAVTAGIAVRPRDTNAIFRPRDASARALIEKSCSTHSVDIEDILNRASQERVNKI